MSPINRRGFIKGVSGVLACLLSALPTRVLAAPIRPADSPASVQSDALPVGGKRLWRPIDPIATAQRASRGNLG